MRILISGMPYTLETLSAYPWPCAFLQTGLEEVYNYSVAIGEIQALTGIPFDVIDAKVKSLTVNDTVHWRSHTDSIKRMVALGTLTAEWFKV